MNERLDLTKVLKDCPKGTEFYSSVHGNVKLDEIRDNRIVFIYTNNVGMNNFSCVSSSGLWTESLNGECILFPSKDQRDWSKWHRPFIDGDIVTTENGYFIGIIKVKNNVSFETYCAINDVGSLTINAPYYFARFATEEEKQKLFDVIKSNGFKWNAETKTLEKLIVPKFKVGDKIRHRLTGDVYKVVFILSNECSGGVYNVLTTNEIGKCINIEEQDNYELVPNKFDPQTLQPFDKVLVNSYGEWFCDFFSHYDDSVNKFNCTCTGGCPYDYCIPYNEETKHLLGTNNEAPEYYKYWEE